MAAFKGCSEDFGQYPVCVCGVFTPWQQPLIFAIHVGSCVTWWLKRDFLPSSVLASFCSQNHTSLSHCPFPVFFLALFLLCALWNSWWVCSAVQGLRGEDVFDRFLENHSRNVQDVLQIYGAGGCWESRVYPAPWGVQMEEANGPCW